MRSFLRKITAILLLQLALYAACVWKSGLRNETSYVAATLDKHARLCQTPPPRIIFLGGSNLAFGIRSDLVERELHRPVINMGLVAGLGIPFMLAEVQSEVANGDLLVLSFEYDLFWGGDNELILRQFLEMRPASLRYVPVSKWKKLITDYGFTILGGNLRRVLSSLTRRDSPPAGPSAYDRRRFDHAGSYTGHYSENKNLTSASPDSPLLAKAKILPISAGTKIAIARFVRLCQARGARCVFTFPPQPQGLLDPWGAVVQHNCQELSEIPGLDILDRPEDEIYPLSQFYDTGYHLTGTAATERTRRIIQALRLRIPTESDEL
jgi:hypothetical protein